jgi:hypothetical protein
MLSTELVPELSCVSLGAVFEQASNFSAACRTRSGSSAFAVHATDASPPDWPPISIVEALPVLVSRERHSCGYQYPERRPCGR